MAFDRNICINFKLTAADLAIGKGVMGQNGPDRTATVFWVDPWVDAEYAQVPERMRVFRNVDEAAIFVTRELPPLFRPDARILTADQILMYGDIVDKNSGPIARIARQHFGPGGQEHRKFQLAISASLALK